MRITTLQSRSAMRSMKSESLISRNPVNIQLIVYIGNTCERDDPKVAEKRYLTSLSAIPSVITEEPKTLDIRKLLQLDLWRRSQWSTITFRRIIVYKATETDLLEG